MGYKASTRIKVASEPLDDQTNRFIKVGEYIEVGEDVSEDDFDEKDWNDLVAAKAVVEEDEFERIHPEVIVGANQATGTPSNLAQVEGSTLQVNLPDPEAEESAPAPPAPVNPADPPMVEGAVDPGDGSDSHGQDYESSSEDVSEEPGGNASTEEWLKYSQGRSNWTDNDADLSRDELREKYGSNA